MSRGRVALRHAVAVVVALGALLLGGLLPPSGPPTAGAAPQAAKPNSVTAYGSAPNQGPDGSMPFPRPPVAIARAGAERTAGYWLASDDGAVRSFGTAQFFGALTTKPGQPVVGIAASQSGTGYWLAAADGGVFAFGAAPFLGSLGGQNLSSPIVAIAALQSGRGYWLVAADGSVFAFGDATYLGAPGSNQLASPIVGMAASQSGKGYWLVAADGRVFAYGDAPFLGAMNGGALPAPVAGIAAPPSGGGYWLVGKDGQVYAFGLPDEGSADDAGPVEGTAVGIAAFAPDGYWVVHGQRFVTQPGASGPDVTTLQQRLTALGFWVGPGLSGTFDNNTTQAVYAFQKLQGLPATGKADPPTRQKLDAATRPKPASAVGDLIEVDKAHQVLIVVRGGQAQYIFNTSTGTEGPYTYAGKTHTAHTPEGRLAFFRQIDGWETSHLGRMYRPKYFDPNGFAVHGDSFVPSYPASHGCVRVSLPAMDFIWAQNLAPIGSQVWVYGTSPPGKLG